MMTRTRIAITAAAIGLAAAAWAQGPMVPPAAPTPGSTPAPDVQYDTSFQPFDDDPVDRLNNIAPLPMPTALFEDYDPLVGLEPYVQTSRVALTRRAVIALATRTARVGETIDIPVYHQSGTVPATVILHLKFDPAIIKILDAVPADWKDTTMVVNAKPQHTDPESTFIVVEYSIYDSPAKAVLMNLRVQALSPGDSAIEVTSVDMSSNWSIPTIARSGMVHVTR